ncbi:hypothetical protein [Streptomyces sp. NPDC059761]|uniref:hypothetical protein n=1 Tax=Streptomyces sp. NPDC059761 TaxID=3346937 RepID=UPI0036547530
MSYPDETAVMGWAEHDAHRDDVEGQYEEPDPDDNGFSYLYDPNVERQVLSRNAYGELLANAKRDAKLTGYSVPGVTVEYIADHVLASVGLLCPPPEPEEGACGAQWPNPIGEWVQCGKDPGHEEEEHQDEGEEWLWKDGFPNAVSAPAWSDEPPF